MVDYRPKANTATFGQESVTVNQGLRSHMLRVYNYMSGGLFITAAVAFAFMNLIANESGKGLNDFGMTLFASPLKWVIMFAPLAMVMFLSLRLEKLSSATAQLCFWVYAALMGISLSTLGLVYTGNSIASAFVVTAVTFGAMSLWGYTTKRDLTAMGSFAMMAVFGIFIAGLVNLFLQSGMLSFVISCISVIAFTLLTAYDTQKIRDVYFDVSHDGELTGKAAVMGALTLYLDFINIFLSLLNLFGQRDE
jgi:FtsH-binding integral membrane protein